MATDLSHVRSPLPATPVANPGYLSMLNLFRVVVCACVLGQHTLLWTDMSNNVVGTAFITMLHYTRDAFFILSGLVVCYAQITRPRSLWGFWSRRYVQIGVPYLAWTAIYVVFTILRPSGSWDKWGSYVVSDLHLGYYQLYVIVVLLQFYLFFPLLLKLLQSTRRHLLVLSVSVAISLFIGTDLHYQPHLGLFGHLVHDLAPSWLPWSRDLMSYQLFFVVGALVAFHLDAVVAFVQRWARWTVAASAVVGGATLLWYLVAIWTGASTGSASDIYEPIAVAWALASSAGIFALSWLWFERRGGTAGAGRADTGTTQGRPRWLSVTSLAELTGGFYFCHILFINMMRAALYSGLVGGQHLAWPLRAGVFYLGTAVCGVAFMSLVIRTPLRWILGGPVRAEQQERDEAEVALRAAGLPGRAFRAGPFGPLGPFGRRVEGGRIAAADRRAA